MKTFGTIESKDYTVEELPVSAPMSWQLTSGSGGITVTDPEFLEGAITVQRASNDQLDFYESTSPKINTETGVYEYLLYRSIKHLFYSSQSAVFYTGSTVLTSSLAGLPDESYVISIGQQFYGNKIKPGTFELTTELANKSIIDDDRGNLYVNESGNITYIGNVFYDKGIAVVKHNTGSSITTINSGGLKLTSTSELYVDYESDVKLYRHEVVVKLAPQEFNFALFNPTILRTYQPTGSLSGSAFTSSMQEQGIRTSGSSVNTYNLYNLMSNNVIKPYITTVGLYNEQYELLAVAKLSEPIQRTFDTDQIFIVRFDTD